MTENYHDRHGKPISLYDLCQREPDWAATRIRVGLKEITDLKAENERLKESNRQLKINLQACKDYINEFLPQQEKEEVR